MDWALITQEVPTMTPQRLADSCHDEFVGLDSPNPVASRLGGSALPDRRANLDWRDQESGGLGQVALEDQAPVEPLLEIRDLAGDRIAQRRVGDLADEGLDERHGVLVGR
jgi:hypothetical protein